MDDHAYDSVRIAAQALGADDFVDLFRWRVRYGDEAAAQRLAQKVLALVQNPAASPSRRESDAAT